MELLMHGGEHHEIGDGGRLIMTTATDSPLRSPERTLDQPSRESLGLGGGTPNLMCVLEVLGYDDIYGCMKYVRGATRGPRGWGSAQGVGRPPDPRGHLEASLTSTPSLLDCFRSKNNSPEGFIRLDSV